VPLVDGCHRHDGAGRTRPPLHFVRVDAEQPDLRADAAGIASRQLRMPGVVLVRVVGV
jgi:hypothetical protein